MPPLQPNFMPIIHPKARDRSTSSEPGLDTQAEAHVTVLDVTSISKLSIPDDESSYSPHDSPTYIHRGVQTSPHLYNPDVITHPHPGPYYLTFGDTQPRSTPFQMPRAVAFPATAVYDLHGQGPVYDAASQRWFRTGNTTVPAAPPHPYPIYPQVPVPQRTFWGQEPFSPLIAPPPKVPLPSPESLALLSEPLRTIDHLPHSVSTAATSPGLVTRPTPLTPSSHSEASPIENPFHTLYKSLRSVLLISEPDPHFLAREINGEQLVSVHGVGVWSVRGTVSTAVEDAKQIAFQAHASYATWLHAARARTAHYATPGVVRPPLRWVLVERGAALPEDALQTGTEANGARLFSARGWWAGGLHLGKAASHLRNGSASIPYGCLECPLMTYEVLVGDKQYAKWLDVPAGEVLAFPPMGSGTIPVGTLNTKSRQDTSTLSSNQIALPASFTPIEGGREAGGEPLLIAQAAHARGWHPGEARLGDDHCCVAYAGGELWVKKFRVLGYNI